MGAEEAIELAGGRARPEDVERVLGVQGARALSDALQVIFWVIAREYHYPSMCEVTFAVTRSTSFDCRTRQLGPDHAVILIPLGILARARSLTRRLLWHLEHEAGIVRVVGSALNGDVAHWEIAPGLKPVLGEGAGDEAGYWQSLAEFDRRTEPDEEREIVAADVMGQCCILLALHEVVHVSAGHDSVVKAARAYNNGEPPHMDLTRVKRGLEIHADVVAAGMHVAVLFEHPRHAKLARRRPDVTFGRTSFAAALLFAMYDVHRKCIQWYDATVYPHPVIRYEFWHEAMVASMRRRRRRRARRYSLDGWKDCVVAFNALEWAVFRSEYGEGARGNTGFLVPVTALKYGSAFILRRWLAEDDVLLRDTVAFGGALFGTESRHWQARELMHGPESRSLMERTFWFHQAYQGSLFVN
ncbi:hypothetical protein [Streptomyces sp. NPDC057686]|uniref:hypothetical protein n=1 Tax=Streptomyces sp. NPDC057686 TaxID=3346212 RepID=UPI0036AAA1ED